MKNLYEHLGKSRKIDRKINFMIGNLNNDISFTQESQIRRILIYLLCSNMERRSLTYCLLISYPDYKIHKTSIIIKNSF